MINICGLFYILQNFDLKFDYIQGFLKLPKQVFLVLHYEYVTKNIYVYLIFHLSPKHFHSFGMVF